MMDSSDGNGLEDVQGLMLAIYRGMKTGMVFLDRAELEIMDQVVKQHHRATTYQEKKLLSVISRIEGKEWTK
jgi:hypothetical protein